MGADQSSGLSMATGRLSSRLRSWTRDTEPSSVGLDSTCGTNLSTLRLDCTCGTNPSTLGLDWGPTGFLEHVEHDGRQLQGYLAEKKPLPRRTLR